MNKHKYMGEVQTTIVILLGKIPEQEGDEQGQKE